MIAPRVPRRRLLSLAASVARRERRSFAADCATMVAALPKTPEVRGLDWIPREGGLCVVANHFQTSSLWIGWAGALLTHAVGEVRGGDPPLHLLVVDGWPLEFGGRTLTLPGSRWAFGRVAHAWSMVATPVEPSDTLGRARALRELGGLARAGRGIGLFPEGERGRAGEPGEALPGVGRWLRLLARAGVVVVPAAVAERGGTLAVAFAPPLDARSAGDPMPAIRALYRELAETPLSGARR